MAEVPVETEDDEEREGSLPSKEDCPTHDECGARRVYWAVTFLSAYSRATLSL